MRHDGIDAILNAGPVIPIVTVADAAAAPALGAALVAGGVSVIEVVLRTPAALDAIRELLRVPGLTVGAGTVLTDDQLDGAIDAGAQFIVSPGLAEPLARQVLASGVPYLPGVASAGDIMRGLALGLDRFKFFPAAATGLPALTALTGPFPDCRFCPTGGITAATASDWLALDQVACVGGAWLAAGAPAEVEAKARAAAGLRRPATSRRAAA